MLQSESNLYKISYIFSAGAGGGGGQLSLLPSAKALFAIIFIIIISDEIFQLSHVIFIIQFFSRKYKMWIKFFRRYMYALRTYFCICEADIYAIANVTVC